MAQEEILIFYTTVADLSKNLNQGKISLTIAENKVLLYFNFVDYYFPNEPGYDTSFFINFLKGEKAVSYSININSC